MRAEGHDDPARYGDGCADFYDDIYPRAPQAALDCLARLAQGGPLLEAGVGTGRYALPLAARGVAVHGIDASAAMLAALRRKPGGDGIATTLGDFSVIRAPSRFRLVICMVDTLSLLPDSPRQAQAIARFADALQPHGHLLLETTFAGGEQETNTQLEITLETRHGTRVYRVPRCPLHADALDGWAAAAGLTHVARWRDWGGRAWNGEHVPVLSLYRRENP